ncbi:MAG: ATPase [Candidatus Cloacimonadota bacterium]|nr:MAG: ATPase [Candidatus Cloacimonadota bacterium]
MDKQILRNKLTSTDGKDYGSYQSLLGTYDYGLFRLIIQQIPKDPYAPPHTGIYRIQVKRNKEQIINHKIANKIQEIAFRDFLARQFSKASERFAGSIRGTGYSGLITINKPGQSILERSCVVIDDDLIEIRCFIGLPAIGRKVTAGIAEQMLFNELPEIVEQSLLKKNIDVPSLIKHLDIAEDSQFLRNKLVELGLVSFIADQSILPRFNGTSEKPMSSANAIPFKSPESLTVEIDLPHLGKIRGMGIPVGVTLIVGGGYHGKSTLLNALELGIYDHIPGDGREFCVSLPKSVKIRAYSGRNIEKTDISQFIKNLPFQKETTAFSTQNASGSTSQAANIMEAVEVGADVLLMDEDTCATNLMIRDMKMQKLVNKNDEPITTFIDKVRQFYLENNISTVLVLGGVGDYFDVADNVIQMIKYEPFDVTEAAHRIAADLPFKRETEDDVYPFTIRERIPFAKSIDPTNKYGKFSVYAKETHRINFGKTVIDLTDLEQLIELSQTKAIAFAIEYAKKYMNNDRTLREIIDLVSEDIKMNGLDIISPRISGNFAWFRGLELAFTMNRLRELDVVQKKNS